MEPEVNELILESLNINYIDESEYPSTTDIQNRCSTPVMSTEIHCQRSARALCQWSVEDNIPDMFIMQTTSIGGGPSAGQRMHPAETGHEIKI